MTMKLRQAAQDIIDYSESREASLQDWPDWEAKFAALRKALEHPVKLAISEEAFNWIDANAPMFVREALAGVNMSPTEQTNMNLNCKSVQARLATSWGYVKAEQAEQKPVAWYGKSKTGNILLSVNCVDEDWKPLYAASVKHVQQEPVGEVDIHMDFLRINWKDGRHPPKGTKLYAAPVQQAEQEPVGVVEGSGEWGIAGVLVAGVPIGTKLYAAPVRTKDLTDDEIRAIRFNWERNEFAIDFARAVIAADREKNNANNNT